jgi:alkaline phosphatase
LAALKPESTDKIFGLFASSHLQYNLLSRDLNQPTLTEMISKSLEILKKNENGFVLLVEGGRIDTAHHDTTAQLALDEAVEFQKAVQYVNENTNEEETLIVVTSDHSTVLTVGGFVVRCSSKRN